MGEIGIHKKLKLGTGVLLALCICLSLYVLLLLDKTDYSQLMLVNAKIEFSSLAEELEAGNTSGLSDYSAIYVTNDGMVQNSTIKEFPEQTHVNLHRFANIEGQGNGNNMAYFQTPIIKQEVQTGTLIAEFPTAGHTLFERYGIFPFIPVFVLLAAIITFLILGYRLISRDILHPFSELGRITKRILEHDYETRLEYDYSGEVGELCHDFEMLRDELCHTKKREEKLRRSEKELLACISHDLKTPLASVSGYVEGIRNNVVTSKEEVDRYLEVIIKKVRFIAKLIDDILEQSKTELNEFTIDLKEVYSKPFLEDIFSEISIDIAKNNSVFTYEEIPNVMINADKDRLLQVIQNIIGNSMKYTGEDSIITAKVTLYEKELVISLRDNGKGIAVNDIPFVFDKFYRGEKARTLNVPGSGLGLYISKYIVECHGGRIECDSVVNEGTTIRFSVRLC